MPVRLRRYSGEEAKVNSQFWGIMYQLQYPYFSNRNVLKLIHKYHLPPWRKQVQILYKAKLRAMDIEVERAKAEGRSISRREAQVLAEASLERMHSRSRAMQKVSSESDDPLLWNYKLLKSERKYKMVSLA